MGAQERSLLVLWGKEDRLIPLTHAQAFAAGIPSARLSVLDDSPICRR
jgi:pimeloyl-ACP methyl ester carboxylesterase